MCRVPVASSANPTRPMTHGHGAAPLWDAASGALFFADHDVQAVHRLDYFSGSVETMHLGYGPVTVIRKITNSSRLLVTVRASVFLLDFGLAGAGAVRDAALRPLSAVDLALPDHVISGGGIDAIGRFWFGTKGLNPERGTVYWLSGEQAAHPTTVLRPVSRPSDMVWALNHSVMYFADAATKVIEAFDFNLEEGTLEKRRTIIDVREYGYIEGEPSGMAIDSAGYLWVALKYAGTVLHINPDERHVIYGYKLPVKRTTAVAWGGPALNELFVMTARAPGDAGGADSPEPLAGAIFTIRGTGNTGHRLSEFYMENADTY